MDRATIILAAAYAVPVALLALLLGRQLPRRVLLLIACLLPVGYSLHYIGLRSLLGWPTSQATVERFTLLGELVVEPDKKTGEAGRVYLWTLAEGDDMPRAHELPYHRGLHEELNRAAQRRRQGHAQQGTRSAAKRSAGATPGHDQQIRLLDRPNPRPPPK